MNFALSADHEMLREAARTFLDREFDVSRLLRPGATLAEAGYETLWAKMAELGWPAMIIPEHAGGLGMSCTDLAMILGECGRTLATTPLVGTLAGTWAILRTGSAEQTARLLPSVATGQTRLALAVANEQGGFDPAPVRATAGTLTGARHFVLDALAADRFVVSARDETGADAFYVVDRGAGVETDPVRWRDISRQVGMVRLHWAPAERLQANAADAWPWIRDRLYFVLAAESAAGLHKVLADTVAYTKQRIAFGRPVGSYQAIKHALAEIKATAECASAAVLYAAWALSENDERASLAAAMAQAYASEAYRKAASRSIQMFGAIGFTWEMPCHLYYKRARANAELLGSPASQRAQVIAMLRAQRRKDEG